jgi:hypothetical protein
MNPNSARNGTAAIVATRQKRIGKDALCPPRDHARKGVVNDSAVTGLGNKRQTLDTERAKFHRMEENGQKDLISRKSVVELLVADADGI